MYKVVHSVYITNICENPENRGWKMTQHSLVNQLEWAERHDCDALVFHPGSPKDNDRGQALEWGHENLREVLICYTGPVQLLLENAAHPKKLGGDLSELTDFVGRLNFEFPPVDDKFFRENFRVGICVDTTHAFAAGYDRYGITREMDALGELLCLVHLNTPDQEVTRGSKLDRHSSTFDQGVFSYDELQKLFELYRHIPLILEGTPDLASDLVHLLSWELELRQTGELQPRPRKLTELEEAFQ